MGYMRDEENRRFGVQGGPAQSIPMPVDAQQETQPAYPVESGTVIRPASVDPDQFEDLCRTYKDQGGKGFIVAVNLSQDDDMDAQCQFLFKEPRPASYDRYVKTASVSSTKAMRTFVLDNVHEEQRRDLEEKLNAYPAMGISLGEKLLYMLGLSKTTTVKRL